RFDGLDQSIISYGPCQFPTLGFIVERYRRIQAFQREAFWSIAMEYCADAAGGARLPAPPPPAAQGGGGGAAAAAQATRASFMWERGRLFDRGVAAALAELCADAGTAVVTAVSARPQTRRRPLPMSTVELQRRASRFLRIPSERAMAAAEALYQRGVLSYPRTETDAFSRETDLAGLVGEFRGNAALGAYAAALLDGGAFEWPREGTNNDNAHPPIHPTASVDPATLHGDERGVYELVARHFLAACSRDARGQQTSVRAHMGEEFSASGLMITERNWLEIYHPWERWSDKAIPTFTVGQEFVPTSLMLTEGRTEPPPLLSESDLIQLMDANRIGTDATIAEHIKKIQERGYAERCHESRFRPTVLGLALVDGYEALGLKLSQPLLRQAQEQDCKLVARRELARADAIARCLSVMKPAFEKCVSDAHVLDAAIGAHFGALGARAACVTAAFAACGNCGTRMDLRVTDAGGGGGGGGGARPLLYCTTCRRGLPLPHRGEIALATPGVACPLCAYEVLEVRPGNGFEGNAYTICPWCYNNPPEEHGGAGVGTFPCFLCSADCPLAKKTGSDATPIAPCPLGCGNSLSIRSASAAAAAAPAAGAAAAPAATTSISLSCSGYPACRGAVWLPRVVASARPAESGATCARCGPNVRRLTLTLRRAGRPAYVPPLLEERRGGGSGRGEDRQRAGGGGGRAAVAAAAAAAGERECGCGAPAPKITVRKDGPNQGRNFFKCATGECAFWEWEHDNWPEGGGGGGRGGGRGDGRRGGAGGGRGGGRRGGRG
ncbi:DNA topoisomerase, partial [Tribonema minus]